ncbi:serine hydrolase domain-containing protein [Fictibacillus fluitans]|uniref:Serine hydrolase domain-containing protein n=1 Tax=Fictibacillus fluitans TaxID=3058422 RepID=A0ABT8HTD4_9BACL|nr:serine hydrolase domain-containing protein [Fictibacillus sp. NE201]MDN4524038.1 serine hydrolase domain-containing protein [Fictibacillus sp. NE201]
MANDMKVLNDFDSYSENLAQKYHVPGIFMALGKEEKIVFEKGIGYRNVNEKLPLSKDTVFGIGSVNKQITAVAVLQLHDQGKLSVHDPVVNYLPEFQTPNDLYTKEMTIHHFLTHTSGLPPLATLYGAMKKSMERDPKPESGEQPAENPLDKVPVIDTYEELMDALSKDSFTLLGKPGTVFSYSNEGYALLGAIIERVSGVPYEQYIKDYITDPAGMHHTVFQYEELGEYDDIAILYHSRKKDEETVVFESNNPWDAPPMRAAGFLKSTVADMLKYSDLFHTGGRIGNAQILTPESVELMTTPYIKCDFNKYYGYGVMIHPDFLGYKFVEHGGAIKGVAAHIGTIPELKLTGAALANLGGVPSTKLLFSAFASYLGRDIEDTELQVEEIPLSLDELKAYEGMFASPEGMAVKFYLEEDKLQASMENEATTLTPVGEDTFLFAMRDSKYAISFLRDENKKIHRVAFGYRQISKAE